MGKNKKKKAARGHPRNDLRHGRFEAPVQGSGTQHISYHGLSAPTAPTALAALPPVPAEFTGRGPELDQLLQLLAPRRTQPPGAAGLPQPTTAVVAGLPGVGKTTLAVTAGHRAWDQGWFSGVQMINLRGYDQTPVPPEQALDALLRSLGIPPEHVPVLPEERANLYRSQLDRLAREGERLLIIADNASDPDQIRPLLPGTPHHRVLVTSRHTLTGLGARLTDLRTLSREDAVDLLRRALLVADPDDRRVDDDPAGAAALARACGFLPLALQITAALLTADPGQPLAERAGHLTTAGGRLTGLDDGSRAVRAAFEQSLHLLTPQQADLFRLLSLNPGPQISTKAASLLADRGEADTRALLNDLARGHLLERSPTERDRWQIHDLLRDCAAEQAAAQAQRSRDVRRRHRQAQARLMEHYLRTAASANKWLDATPGQEGVAGLFASREEALSWMDDERPTLTALGHVMPDDPRIQQLVAALTSYLRERRYLDDLYAMAMVIRDIARETGNRAHEGMAWGALGTAAHELSRYEEALAAFTTSRDIAQETGNREYETAAWAGMSSALQQLRRFEEALVVDETVLAISQEMGDREAEAKAWNTLGIARADLKRHEEAIAAFTAGREIAREIGDRGNEADAWKGISYSLKDLGRFEEALRSAQAARDIAREIGDRDEEARAWNGIGLGLQGLGRFEEAVTSHTTARDMAEQTGDQHFQAVAWNNLGTACRGAGRHAEAVEAGERAAGMFTELGDQHRAGLAFEELATTLEAAESEADAVVAAWRRSAAAFAESGAEQEAAESRRRADEAAAGNG